MGRDGVRSSILIVALLILDLTGLRDPFASINSPKPSNDWQTRNGQLMYRTAKTTLIGEVFVRFSKNGDFELTFSKGPGVTLLTLRQNNSFAEAKGALAPRGWSARSRARRNNCAAGSSCATKSFMRKIDNPSATSAARKLFFSILTAAPGTRASASHFLIYADQ